MAIQNFLKKISALKEKILKAHRYDELNLSDEVRTRSPLATRMYDKEVEAFRKIMRTDADVQLETDINMAATLELADSIKFTSVEKSAAGNLISVKIVAGAALNLSLRKNAITITTEDTVTTYDDIIAAIEADSKISALVAVEALTNSGDAAVAASLQYLAGGK